MPHAISKPTYLCYPANYLNLCFMMKLKIIIVHAWRLQEAVLMDCKDLTIRYIIQWRYFRES